MKFCCVEIKMARALDLPKIPPFSSGETSTISQRLRKWMKSFEY